MLSATFCSDVLAIRCINKYVCIGIGNCVHVYLIDDGRLVDKREVFENDNIHGIIKGANNEVYVYGGKNFGICELSITEHGAVLSLRSVQCFDDWIIALGWAAKGRFLSLLFAHNNLRFYNTSNKNIQTFWCQERCILYGGSVLAKSSGESVVFSGTAFQEILIWRVKYNCECTKDVAILHRLKGHKGVIFSVIYDSALEMIISTSDDRTVRVWRVENENVGSAGGINWENCKVSFRTTMYGHTARVWRSIVRKEKIISIGEDSLMCIWSLDGKLLNKVEVHNGAKVWSIDVSDDDKKIFTGGADGAVNVWSFESGDVIVRHLIYESDEKKVPKFVFYAQCGNILIFMDGGHLISYNSRSKKIDASLNLPRYASYCVMQISPDRTKFGLGSKDGRLEIFEANPDTPSGMFRKVSEKNVMESKIFALHWLSNTTIIVYDNKTQADIFDLFGKELIFRLRIFKSTYAPWSTAAIVFENFLVCSDRVGSVFIYDYSKSYAICYDPVQVYFKIHRRFGVQSFAISANRLISTGRDGTVRFFELSKCKTAMKTLHVNKMPMDWVCRILPCDDDLHVLGFKEAELIVYSMKLKRIVQRFVCGGGHRSWDCILRNGKIDFLHIRDKRVFELGAEFQNIEIPIKSGFHTKEIYCVEPIETLSAHKIFVSASEDRTLRLSCIVKDPTSTLQKYRVKTLHTYDGHISNVKSLATMNITKDDKSTWNYVISGGGRGELKIWEAIISVDRETLTESDVACRELWTQKMVWDGRYWGNKSDLINEPEPRLMDIKVRFDERCRSFFYILVACSDGYLRVFSYDLAGHCLFYNYPTYNLNRCNLKINMFSCGFETIIISMCTDGVARIEQMKKSVVETRVGDGLCTEVKIHQSGINSFDLRQIDDSRYLLLTGGDDNLLSLKVLEYSSPFENRILTSWSSSSIHSAQITGAKFVGENRILSAGIDQRLVVHSYTYHDGILSVSKIEETTTLVADVQGVALLPVIDKQDETLACVYGKGFEIIILNHDT